MQQSFERISSNAELLSAPREPADATRRVGFILGGSVLVALGMRTFPLGLVPAALGLGAIYRGIAPARIVRRALDVQRTTHDDTDYDFIAVRAVTINRPVDDLMAFWCATANIARFLSGVASVAEIDDNTWRWRSSSEPATEWTTMMSFGHNDDERTIHWRSSPHAPFTHEGLARFRPAPGHRGTELTVRLSYSLPGGTTGALAAALGGKEPGLQLATDLHTLKQLLETGQVSTVDGQPSARPQDTPPPAIMAAPPEKDLVQRGSEGSFPASDAPSWMAGSAIPEPSSQESSL